MNSPLGMLSRMSLYDVERVLGAMRGRQQISRAYNTAFGLVNYDLQRPAKQTEVFYFPILNMMPHVQGNGDVATHFKVINHINTGLVEGWVPEGARQQQIASSLSDAQAAYATFGLEDGITWEARGAANALEDAMARMQGNLMLETQRRLEKAVTFANANQHLGTTGTPVLADVGTGGTIGFNTAISVRCVALSSYGLEASAVATGIVQPATYVGPDGKTVVNGFGAAQKSAVATITTANDANATHVVTATVAPVLGAAGYAWFIGPDATHQYLWALTSTNSVRFTDAGDNTKQNANGIAAADYSYAKQTFSGVANQAFDGLLSLALQNGTVITQATGTPGTGTPLTTDGAGGIIEVENLLAQQWDLTHTSPKWLIMSGQEMGNIRKKVIAGGAAPLFRFNVDAGDTAPISAGRIVGSYLNIYQPDGGSLIRLILHPYCPKGTILAFTDTLPGELIPNNNIGQLFEFHLPSPEDEMRATQWPVITREYRTGVYIRGTVAHYFPQSMGVITNIANG